MNASLRELAQLGREGVERDLGIRSKGLTKNLAAPRLGGASVSRGAPLEPGDELAVDVADEEVGAQSRFQPVRGNDSKVCTPTNCPLSSYSADSPVMPRSSKC